jgi:hypothetical protein
MKLGPIPPTPPSLPDLLARTCMGTPPRWEPGEITPSYILHTCAIGTYLWGVIYLAKKNYKVMVFYM